MTPEDKEKLIENNKEKYTTEISELNTAIMLNSKTSFLSGPMFKNKPIFVSNLPMPTAGTDGRQIYIDPEFWMKQSDKQKMRVLFHEAFHMMMGHCDVRINTNTHKLLWNIAADAVTESLANECNIGEGKCAGEGGVNPTAYGSVKLSINGKSIIIGECNQKSVEEIYNVLAKHIKDNPPKGNENIILDENGKPIKGYDNHTLGESTQEEKNQREQELRQALVEHKLKGTLPGGLAGVLERMLKGKVNWKSELRDMVIPEIKSQPSYNRPNRRGQALNINLPGVEKEGVDVVFAIDTSGSIGENELMYFLGEVDNLFSQFNGMAKATLLFHTMDVYKEVFVDDIRKLEGIQTETGGTSHIPVMARAEELNAKVLICLTDGYSCFPPECKINKILWILTEEHGEKQVPDMFGKKIVIDKRDLSGE